MLHAVLPIMASPYFELIDYEMPAGVQDMIIPFSVEKVSPVIMLSGPMIINVVDMNPLTGLSFTVTNISTSLLAIQLNALLPAKDEVTGPLPGGGSVEDGSSDVSNYRFRALATVVG